MVPKPNEKVHGESEAVLCSAYAAAVRDAESEYSSAVLFVNISSSYLR